MIAAAKAVGPQIEKLWPRAKCWAVLTQHLQLSSAVPSLLVLPSWSPREPLVPSGPGPCLGLAKGRKKGGWLRARGSHSATLPLPTAQGDQFSLYAQYVKHRHKLENGLAALGPPTKVTFPPQPLEAGVGVREI